MLILPPGHTEALRARRPLAAREKKVVGTMLSIIAVLAIVLVVSLGTSGTSSHNGCIYATIPAATGAQQVSQCGPAARETCATVRAPGAFTANAADTIATECRKAGLPVR